MKIEIKDLLAFTMLSLLLFLVMAVAVVVPLLVAFPDFPR